MNEKVCLWAVVIAQARVDELKGDTAVFNFIPWFLIKEMVFFQTDIKIREIGVNVEAEIQRWATTQMTR